MEPGHSASSPPLRLVDLLKTLPSLRGVMRHLDWLFMGRSVHVCVLLNEIFMVARQESKCPTAESSFVSSH